MNKNLLYRNIPKVDILLENEKIQELIEAYGRETVVETIREKLEMLREYIKECEEEEKAFAKISSLVSDIEREVIRINTPDIRSVINGTGTILHTNLGRAPISPKHMQYVAEIATGYSNLEYNLEEGKRGERYSHFEKLLCKITGADGHNGSK